MPREYYDPDTGQVWQTDDEGNFSYVRESTPEEQPPTPPVQPQEPSFFDEIMNAIGQPQPAYNPELERQYTERATQGLGEGLTSFQGPMAGLYGPISNLPAPVRDVGRALGNIYDWAQGAVPWAPETAPSAGLMFSPDFTGYYSSPLAPRTTFYSPIHNQPPSPTSFVGRHELGHQRLPDVSLDTFRGLPLEAIMSAASTYPGFQSIEDPKRRMSELAAQLYASGLLGGASE